MSSKALVTVLRHRLPSLGISWDGPGYADVDDILKLSTFNTWDFENIKQIVDDDNKERFHLRKKGGKWQICATQGHSFKVDTDDLNRIQDASEHPKVIHGTTYASWEKIKHEGIKRFRRQHIHFAKGEIGDASVVSGCPCYTEVYIYLNLTKAIKDGYQFFLSRNGVILSTGNKDGVIPPVYFKRVTSKNGEDLL